MAWNRASSFYVDLNFFFLFWLCHATWSVLWPGIEPGPWQWKPRILPTGIRIKASRKLPRHSSFRGTASNMSPFKLMLLWLFSQIPVIRLRMFSSFPNLLWARQPLSDFAVGSPLFLFSCLLFLSDIVRVPILGCIFSPLREHCQLRESKVCSTYLHAHILEEPRPAVDGLGNTPAE